MASGADTARAGNYKMQTWHELPQHGAERMANVYVHFLPLLVEPGELAGGTVVVIDVLRASTTIAHALAAGCREVIPCLEIDDARQTAARLPPGTAVLGGERGGLPIEGFAVGNSPDECHAGSVGGKSLVFTTTNGTRAMLACRLARRVLVGAFVNLSAVCRRLADDAGASNVHLLCAGTRGQITREDVLFAGAVVDVLSRDPRGWKLNDQAAIARDAWRQAMDVSPSGADVVPDTDDDPLSAMRKRLAEVLLDTQGGRNLRSIGLQRDVAVAAEIDRFDLVGELNVAEWTIRAR